jgi:hypothetical protein
LNKWLIFSPDLTLYQAGVAIAFFQPSTMDGTSSQEGRYLAESLPSLPFRDNEFELALCSHFLFLYTEQLSLDFHKKAVAEMVRVAKEVRIFPLIYLDLNKSRYIPTICSELHQAGITVEILKVPYEFQRGGNKMMRICSK